MSSSEFAEWMIFLRTDPELEIRMDWTAALICATVSNVFRAKGPPATPEDYLLTYSEKDHSQYPSTEELEIKLTSWMSGLEKRGKEK